MQCANLTTNATCIASGAHHISRFWTNTNANFVTNASGAEMLWPNLVQLTKSISGSVLPLTMFNLYAMTQSRNTGSYTLRSIPTFIRRWLFFCFYPNLAPCSNCKDRKDCKDTIPGKDDIFWDIFKANCDWESTANFYKRWHKVTNYKYKQIVHKWLLPHD